MELSYFIKILELIGWDTILKYIKICRNEGSAKMVINHSVNGSNLRIRIRNIGECDAINIKIFSTSLDEDIGLTKITRDIPVIINSNSWTDINYSMNYGHKRIHTILIQWQDRIKKLNQKNFTLQI